MILTTTQTIQGRTITGYQGIVVGETIMGANFLRDMFARVTDIVGGRSGQYENKLRDAREAAMADVEAEARAVGADAVVGIDIDYEIIGDSMMMVSVSGTAGLMTVAVDTQPLRLHWWKAVPNFGDAISPVVLAHVSGRVVVHAGVNQAEVWAVGSLLQVVKRAYAAAKDFRPLIWGTGVLHPVHGTGFKEHVDIALVRGPITADLLGLECSAIPVF